MPKIRYDFNFFLKFKLNDRNRFENRLMLTPPVKLTGYNIQPYLADEIFISFEENELNRNRIYIGFKIKLFKNVALDQYYLLESNKKLEDWTTYNIIGSRLKVAF